MNILWGNYYYYRHVTVKILNSLEIRKYLGREHKCQNREK